MIPVNPDIAYLSNRANYHADPLQYYVESMVYFYDYLCRQGQGESAHAKVLEAMLIHYDSEHPDIGPWKLRGLLLRWWWHYGHATVKRYSRIEILSQLFTLGMPQPGSGFLGGIRNILQVLRVLLVSAWAGSLSVFSYWRAHRSSPEVISLPAERIMCTLIRYCLFLPLGEPDMRTIIFGSLIFLYGPLGASLFLCTAPGASSGGQLANEFERLIGNDLDELISNYYLFMIAANLEIAGYRINFVPETAQRTPDLEVSLNGVTYFLEATVKRPADENRRVTESISAAIREKQRKFVDPQFHPGIICVDVSTHRLLSDSVDGDSSFETNHGGFRTYDAVADTGFFRRGNNWRSNLVRNIRRFRAIPRAQYNVVALFTGTTRVIEFDPVQRAVSQPRRVSLIADSAHGTRIPWEMAEGTPRVFLV